MAEWSGEGLDINSYTENYLRLHLLEVKGGTTVLRNLFLKIVRNSPAKGDVNKYLGYFERDIQRHKQGSEELKILFPDSGPTDIDKWDVSLLAYVLEHCCTLEGQLNLKRKQKPRQILKREIEKHGDLRQFLSDNQRIFDDLIITCRITEQQYETLYPQNHQPVDFENWDVELVLQVLLEVCYDADSLQKVRSVCIDVLKRQVEIFSTNIVLDELLKHHQFKFDQFKKEGKLTDNQYKQIFPDKCHSDATNWDNEVLICVVVNTCHSLSQLACKRVKVIRQMRKELGAHTTQTKISNDDFLEKWTDLHGAIIGTTENEIPETLTDVKKTVCSIRRSPLDIQNSFTYLREWYSNRETKYHNIILERLSAIELNAASTTTVILRKLDEHSKIFVEILRRLPEPGYSQTRSAEEVKVAIHVNGKNEEAVTNAETSTCKAMNGIEDDDTKPLLPITDKIKQMQSNDGNEIERIERGSIILVVKCSSLRAVHNLLKTLKSSELKKCLGQLQDVLTKINKCSIRLSIHLTNSSLLKIMEMVVKLAPQSEETSSPDEQNTLQTVLEVSSDLKKHQEDTNEAASAPGVPQASETKPWSGDDEIREAASVPGVPQASEAKPWPGDDIFREAASDPGVPQASEAKPWSLDDETRDIKKKFEKRQWLKTETTSDAWVPQKLSTKPWQGDHELMETTSDPLVSQTLSTKPWPGDHELNELVKKVDEIFERLPTTDKDTRRLREDMMKKEEETIQRMHADMKMDPIPYPEMKKRDEGIRRLLEEMKKKDEDTDIIMEETKKELEDKPRRNEESLKQMSEFCIPTTDKVTRRLREELTEKTKIVEKGDLMMPTDTESLIQPTEKIKLMVESDVMKPTDTESRILQKFLETMKDSETEIKGTKEG